MAKPGPKIPTDTPRLPPARPGLRPGTIALEGDELTPYQQKFVSSYISVARFNAAEAARIAGSTMSDNTACHQAYRTLNLPQVQKAIREHLDSLKTEGLRVLDQRVSELEELYRSLIDVQTNRAASLKARKDAGEDIPTEALSGLMIEVTRKNGMRSWELDKTLIQERQRIAEAIAKELGERNERIQITTAAINVSDTESAKQKLLELISIEGNGT